MSENAKQNHSDALSPPDGGETKRPDGRPGTFRSDESTSSDESVWRPAELKPARRMDALSPLSRDADEKGAMPTRRLPHAQGQESATQQEPPEPRAPRPPTDDWSPPPQRRVEPTRRLSHSDVERERGPVYEEPTTPLEQTAPGRASPEASQGAQYHSPSGRKPSGSWEPTQRIPTWESTSRTEGSTSPTWDQPTVATPPLQQPPPPPAHPPAAARPATEPVPRGGGCSWAHALLWLTLLGVIIFFLGLVAASVGYIVLAAQLPSPDELRAREPDFASSRIYDRDGQLLYEIMDPNTGKRTYVPISQISRSLQLATVATEDRNFYDHVGFDPFAIARAVFYALQEREIVSGASTITQQVARNILLDPEERTEVSASRKIKEIVLAAELSRKYSKEEILEIYLNNNNYGNLAYGVDAAARTYFGTTAGNLTVGQAAFLAGLPQSPATYDPYGGGLDAALKRQRTVLALMVEAGFITQEQADVAAAEMAAYQFPSIYTDRIPAPHFVFYVRQWVEENLGADLLYQGGGLRIYTTLDAQLQTIAEQEVTQGVANLAGRNVTNGALVAVEPPTGYILAMVGSVDFYDQARGGQVNVILRCRQPGSAIKPLTYLTAFEKGWTPATIVWDVPTTYTDTAGNVYRPVNYDGRFRGATSVRTALANSLNIPAVRTLNFVSVDGLLAMSERLGVTSLVSPHLECPEHPYETRPFYGLALALGGGELKPLELTAAYATFANNGDYLEPTPILWIEDSEGNLLVDHRTRGAEQVVSPQHAYLVTHILADTQARCLVFHCPSILELPDRPVAAKTGTTNDNRDAWTVGYTPDLAVGVWVGNNDNSEMAGVVGSSGAGPIWNAFMQRAHEGIPPHPFPRPPGIVEREICTLSGTEPGRYCPEQRREIFYQQQLPPGEDKSWFQAVKIDAASGLRANAFCTSNVIEKVMLILDPEDESMVPHDPRLDPKGRRWLEQWAVQNNIEIAPKDYCTEGEQEPTVRIVAPAEREAVAGSVEIRGTVDIPEFDHYEITYGVGDNPQGWGWISGPHEAIVRDGLIGLWEAGSQEPGVYTVRVVAYNKRGTQFESHVVIVLEAPTPTPTPTSEDTATPTPTSSPQVTSTPTPTSVPPTATPTLLPPTPVPLTATPTSMPPTATMPPITETPTPMSTPPPQTPTPESTPTLPPQTPTSEPLPTLVPPVVESPTPQSNE